jgi:hypothetical protein
MEKHCKICGHKMIHSAVGWLCPKCGNVEKMTSAQAQEYTEKAMKPVPNTKPDSISIDEIKPLDNTPTKPQKGMKHRVKSMFVPKITDHQEIMEDHLLSSGTADENHLVTPSKKEITQLPSARIKDQSTKPSSDEPDTKLPDTDHGTITDQTAPIPKPPKHKTNHGLLIFIAVLVFIVISVAVVLLIFADNSINLFNKNSQTNQNTATQNSLTPEQARDNQRKKDLHEIADALAKYFNSKGSYPAGADIRALYPLQYTSPVYITHINYDPSSTDTEKIKYFYVSNGKTYILKAKLEDANDPDAQDGYFVQTSTQ